jgi:predicted nuclease of predicted toxin-antitoxin system
MSPKFHKFKLLLDENMPARRKFERLNHRFDVKHIAFDLRQSGLSDEAVYNEAARMRRLIVTFNGKDFQAFAARTRQTGILFLSQNVPDEQIDKKLVSFLLKKTPNALYGKFTTITGET